MKVANYPNFRDILYSKDDYHPVSTWHHAMSSPLSISYYIIIIIIFFFHIKDSILFLADPSRENKCMLILHAYFKQGASNHNLNMKHSI